MLARKMKKPQRLFQYLSALTVFLSLITSGLHYAWPSPSLPLFISGNTTSFQLTADEGSWIVITLLISAPISCFFGAFVSDKIGRKKTILLTSIPYAISWLLIAFARSFVELCIARLIAGISDGMAFTAIPMYIGEIADPEIRGLLGVGISVTWMFGMFLMNIIGSQLTVQVTALICSIVPVLFFLCFVWMPESPYYLLMKNDVDSARGALKRLRGVDNVDVELNRMLEAFRSRKQGNLSELFTLKSNRKALGFMAVVRNSQQMSGTSAITYYTLTIFQDAGDFMTPVSATILYVGIQCLMTMTCSLLIDKTGRRPLLITSLVGSTFSLFLAGTYFYLRDQTNIDVSSVNFLPVVALISFVIMFNVGAQPIPLLMIGELFPPNVKSLAACCSEVYFCVLAALASKFFQVTRDAYGSFVPFYGFAACCVVNLVCVVFFVPETKGKTLEEIQNELGNNKM